MIDLELLSPKIYLIDDTIAVVTLSHNMFYDNLHNIKIPVKHTVMIECKERLPNGKLKLPIELDFIDLQTATFLYEIKNKIGACVQLAETLFENLKIVNSRLVCRDVNGEVFKKHFDKYSGLDFMGHRNLLSDIIKSKKEEIISTILVEYNSKKLTKTFYNFILDRNKYTHGDLMYFQNMRTTILKYLTKEEKEEKEEFAIVSQEIITSFITCYEKLNQFLSKLLKALNEDEYQKLFPKLPTE